MITININNTEQITRSTSTFKILSDPTRFKILYLLADSENGLCVFELANELDISHSAVSHQLSKLEARDVVLCFRQGQNVCYEIKKSAFTSNLINAMKLFL